MMLKFDDSRRSIPSQIANSGGAEVAGIDLPYVSYYGDLISMLHSEEFARYFSGNVRPEDGWSSVEEWVCTFESSSKGPQYKPHELKRRTNPDFLLTIDRLRELIVKDIEGHLLERRISSSFPMEGVCLLYPDTLRCCYLVQYKAVKNAIHIGFKDRIDAPQALLSLEDAARLPKMKSRNVAKAFIQGGHKIVLQCGVLTHVDRHEEPRVFGPTIDTLIMSSIACDFAISSKIDSVLEVGVGSGHILSSLISFMNDGGELFGVDLEPDAISCAAKNIHSMLQIRKKKIKRTLWLANFEPKLINKRFDLIVSNPPYVSEVDVNRRVIVRDNYEKATVSSDLIGEMLSALPNLLSEGGRALLMLSSVTAGWQAMVPAGFTFESACEPSTLRVPFEVERVLDDDSWLSALVERGAIEKDGDNFFHSLQPIWVRRVGG